MSLKKKHSLPLDEFINFSLYNKNHGYYMKKKYLEKRGISLLHQTFQDFFQKSLLSGLLVFGKVWVVLKNLT